MDLELIKHANNYILKMANGINPLTNEQLPEDDLVNNIKKVLSKKFRKS